MTEIAAGFVIGFLVVGLYAASAISDAAKALDGIREEMRRTRRGDRNS